jgi:hypothetical protein
MDDYTDATYGDRIAAIYDDWIRIPPEETERAIDCLAALAGGGAVMELGIGTGRIAIPLAARGVAVHGIDASEAMVAQLRAKPGGEHIPVTIDSFVEITVEGQFNLIYVVFNTFFGLRSQDEQVRCFASVAARLSLDGVFVLEAFVPDPTRFVRGQLTQTSEVGSDHVRFDVSRHDPVSQRVRSQHVVMRESGIRLCPVEIRYAWPSELDLMARLAGLRLHARWGGWDRRPFTATSSGHISIYERDANP